jgi:hypothetical protein
VGRPRLLALKTVWLGYDASWLPGSDSGGECGVAYNAYFPFASQNPTSSFPDRQPWSPTATCVSNSSLSSRYEFDYGSAHVIIMSTEHDFTEGSVQVPMTLASLYPPYVIIISMPGCKMLSNRSTGLPRRGLSSPATAPCTSTRRIRSTPSALSCHESDLCAETKTSQLRCNRRWSP